MSIASADELAGMTRAGRVVALALEAMRETVVPGAPPAGALVPTAPAPSGEWMH